MKEIWVWFAKSKFYGPLNLSRIRINMGNRLARNRLKAQDFHYIAKNTAFLTNDVSRFFIYIFYYSHCSIFRLFLIITTGWWRKAGRRGRLTRTPSSQFLGDMFIHFNASSLHFFSLILLLLQFNNLRLAFPERPEAKLDALIEKLRNVDNTSGTIRM